MKGRVTGFDHVGIAVRDPRERLGLWADLLGLPLERAEAVPTEGVRTWFLTLGEGWVELLEPLADDSPIARAIDKRGEGMHHLCVAVDDIEAVLARLAARGVMPIGGGARPGAGGCTVAFLHPKDTGGVLLELSENPARAARAAAATPFAPGALVVAYLAEPRERFAGLLCALDGTGVAVRGLELTGWDEWVAQHRAGHDGPIVPSLQFFPLARVAKLQLDEDSAAIPSLARSFAERTGGDLAAALRAGDGA